MTDIPEWIKHIHIFHYLNINYDKLPINPKLINKINRYLLKSFHPDNKIINNPSEDIMDYFSNHDINHYKNKLIKNDKLFEFLNFIKNNLNFLFEPIMSIKLNDNFKLKYLYNIENFSDLKNSYKQNYDIQKEDVNFEKIVDTILSKNEVKDKLDNYKKQSIIIKDEILNDKKKELLKKDFNKIFENNIINDKNEIINYNPVSYNLIKNNYYDINNKNDGNIDEFFKISKLDVKLNRYNELIKNNDINKLANIRINELKR